MSLNNIQLTPSLAATLYGDSLNGFEPATIPAIAPAQASPEQEKPYRVLGSNAKKILLLVNEPGQAFLDDSDLQFLTRMLEACMLHLGDVSIVNHASRPLQIEALRAQLHPAFVLLFGITPAEIGLPLIFPQFKQQAYAGCQYLYAPSIADLNQDGTESKILKSKLWVCLRKMFAI